MTSSLLALLRGLVDYAGTFPPARLSLDDAVRAYSSYRAGKDAWLLGSLVMSSKAVDEFPGSTSEMPWPIAVVIAREPQAEIERVIALADRWTGTSLAAVEFAPVLPSQIRELAARVPKPTVAFFEVPLGADLERRLEAIGSCGASAKIRTGGLTVDAFPAASSVYRFLRACRDRRIACKATAGLHHAVSGDYPLTYDADSQRATMNGFLNLCMLAAFVNRGSSEQEALDVLDERSGHAFDFGGDALAWRGHHIAADELAEMRRDLFRSFGSCSFIEPVEDLQRLGLS